MAELLAAEDRSLVTMRRQLQDEGSGESDDLLSRLNAIDYLNTLVGEVGGELPERLGEYRITGLLGRGGMGTVFEAFQESLEREVALKVLSPTLTADPKMRKRFRTEARASATLHHQHIVPVYGFGESAGFLYFTMERVPGVSLDKHISMARHTGENALEPREAARRFAGVADALSHAHRRGILHRDVKPGNILVHPDGSLALADFGLAKMVGEASMSVSAHGGFLGTLHYASPEQAKGQDLTASSDLYSLGVTMYEALTGRLPVYGKTTEAMLRAVLYENPRPLRDRLPKAPKDLEAVLRKLLSKDPADRYADGEALARDLTRVADDEPVRIRRQSPVVLLWRQVRKHPSLTAALVIASSLLMVSFGLWRAKEEEHVQGQRNRHENILTSALTSAEGEPGPADGPGGLLAALTGFAGVGADPEDSSVLALLEEAHGVQPDDPRPELLRAAYLEDPIPEVTRYLHAGSGYPALRLLDQHLSDAERKSGFASRDAVTWMRLYRLYLGRAVASLSSAVADPEAAGKDLLRASLVRPGAFFPAVLMSFLEWSPGDGADHLFARLDDLMVDAPRRAEEAVGSLLLAFAGLQRPIAANLMDFDLPYAMRRELHERGARLLGEAWDSFEGRTTPLLGWIEVELAEAAQLARASLGDRPKQRAALDRGRKLLTESAAPRSPLQSWALVYDFLEDSRAPVASLPNGQAMPLGVQLRGWRQLLELDPPPDVLRVLQPVLEELLDSIVASANEVETRRLKALMARRLGSEEEALAAANAWVEADPENPDAYVCRFHCRLRQGDVGWASTDGVTALQRAIDRDEVAGELADFLEEAVEAGGDLARDWARLRESFR